MIHNTARLPLPALVSAGVAGDLRSGKQLIGADGSIVTGTMPEVAGKTITPGTTAQTAVAAGRYVTGNVVVAGDANLKAENIAEGVSIFGVTGTHSGGGGGGAIIEVDKDTYVNNKERDAGMIGEDYGRLGFYLPPQSILESLFEFVQDTYIYIGESDSGPVLASVDLNSKHATIEGNFLVTVFWGEGVLVNDEAYQDLVLRYFLYKN